MRSGRTHFLLAAAGEAPTLPGESAYFRTYSGWDRRHPWRRVLTFAARDGGDPKFSPFPNSYDLNLLDVRAFPSHRRLSTPE